MRLELALTGSLLLIAPPILAQTFAPRRPVATYSIVARDPVTGEMGVAVQSHWFSVGAIVPWAEAGASGLDTDIAATADATGSTGWSSGWIDFDVTDAVQAMSDGADNYGWKLVGVSGNRNTKQFYSGDYTGDSSLRPRLTIQYSSAP